MGEEAWANYQVERKRLKSRKQQVSGNVTRWRRTVKQKAVELLGGKCLLCGYSKCLRSLHFHHLDPTTKSFGVAQGGVSRGWDKVQEELKKCVLLCSNCHGEVEDGMTIIEAHVPR